MSWFYSKTSYVKSESSFYNPHYGNYRFDTSLTDFGMMLERKVRKVNRKGSVLKLKDVKESNSIYPMLDEFGYTFMDFFIFRSTWDQGYHFETTISDPKPVVAVKQFNRKSIQFDNVEKVLADFEKENFSIGRAYRLTRDQNNLER